jgi:hypothetical protein
MRTSVLALTTAITIGALTAPMVAAAQSGHGMVGGNVRAGRSNTTAAPTYSGGAQHNFSAGPNTAWKGQNWSGKNWSGKNWSGNNWSGKNWAWDGRHHRRHHRNFAVVPFVGFDDYAYADSCWDYVWTPAGYERVYVCGGPDYYAYYDY